ncbi:MAG: hypothetical protein IJL89_05330 [Firmicutes bacterium]|nr:hypothetical protein [Bacillota bacterium]
MKFMKNLIFCLALMLMFSGCGKDKNQTLQTTEPTTETPIATTTAEPTRAAESPEEFLDFGVFINVPKDSEDVSYNILNGDVAEINFKYEGVNYVLRGTNTDKALTDDINEEYKEVRDTIANEVRSVTVLATVSGRRTAQWNYEGTNFALTSKEPVEFTEFSKLCTWLAFPD